MVKRIPRRVLNRIAQPGQSILLPPAIALRSVTSKSGLGVYASSDTLFKGAVFGRDSLEVAEDLMKFKPKLVQKIITTLGSLQGETVNDVNEELPGKIIHEYRNVVVDGRKITGISRQIFDELSSRWGGSDSELRYYGSVDSTPLFLRVLFTFAKRRGSSILEQTVTLKSGLQLTLLEVAERAADLLVELLSTSRSGMLEYCRRNPRGIENQVWKDSNEFYVHEDGTPVNHRQPIVSIEVQSLVYDALKLAAEFLPARASEFNAQAFHIQALIIDKLWLDDMQYFALGIDYNERGEERTIRTKTANPAAMLDSTLFDDLDSSLSQQLLTGIIETVLSSDFLTDAGIRSRALSASRIIPYWDYHGTFACWPKETYDIAKGLRRHGFMDLAKALENRILNIVLKSKRYPEFVYVDSQGRVLASAPATQSHGSVALVDSTNEPERVQAWTVSAVTAIINERSLNKLRLVRSNFVPTDWQYELEKKIVASIPHINYMLNPWALSARYPTYPYMLNRIQSPDSVHANINKAKNSKG